MFFRNDDFQYGSSERGKSPFSMTAEGAFILATPIKDGRLTS